MMQCFVTVQLLFMYFLCLLDVWITILIIINYFFLSVWTVMIDHLDNNHILLIRHATNECGAQFSVMRFSILIFLIPIRSNQRQQL